MQKFLNIRMNFIINSSGEKEKIIEMLDKRMEQ